MLPSFIDENILIRLLYTFYRYCCHIFVTEKYTNFHESQNYNCKFLPSIRPYWSTHNLLYLATLIYFTWHILQVIHRSGQESGFQYLTYDVANVMSGLQLQIPAIHKTILEYTKSVISGNIDLFHLAHITSNTSKWT